MDSQIYIGRPGVPTTLTGLGPLDVRRCLQPQNDREEYLLAMLEEAGEEALDNEMVSSLGCDYEDGDDGAEMAAKLRLREERDAATRQLRDTISRNSQLHALVRQVLATQGLIASQDERMQALLDGMEKIRSWFDISN